MSFKENFDLTQETKKVFANFLIFNMKQIEFQIFFSRDVAAAIRSMRGLIGSLDEKGHKKLDSQLKRLEEFDAGRGCSRLEIEQIYREICAYLHKAFLREQYFARPRYQSGKLEVPAK